MRPELLTATPAQRRWMEQDPTYVVSWDIFQNNQFPYLEVRRPFILGTRQQQWKATISHRFLELLHTKTSKLTRIYTQNIDGLDRQCTDIPPSKIISVHGSIAQASCEGCGAKMDYDEFCAQVQTQIKDIYQQDDKAPSKSSPICCSNCRKPLIKPSTVLFGRQLPEEFWENSQEDLPKCDLLIVAGTSLVVAPANLLVQNVSKDCIRFIVNLERVGMHLGIDYGMEPNRDCFAEGTCDEVFLALIEELGWMDDLKEKIHLLPPSSRELIERESKKA